MSARLIVIVVFHVLLRWWDDNNNWLKFKMWLLYLYIEINPLHFYTKYNLRYLYERCLESNLCFEVKKAQVKEKLIYNTFERHALKSLFNIYKYSSLKPENLS